MPKFRNVFFSFHYADVMLASQIRNCEQFIAGMSFRDWAAWESVRLRDDNAIAKWIDDQLDGTSVTVVLIGDQTASRKWVHYEIIKSVERGNGLVAIHLNRMRGPRHPGMGPQGFNPLAAHDPRRRPGIIESKALEIGFGASAPTTMGTGLLVTALRDVGLEARTPPAQWWESGMFAVPPSPSTPYLGLLASALSDSPGLGMVPLPTKNYFADIARLAPPPKNPLGGMVGLGQHQQIPKRTLADEVDCYCWEDHQGCYKIADWIEKAAKQVGR